MKTSTLIPLVVVLVFLVVLGTMHKPQVTPEEKQARREASAAREAKRSDAETFCIWNAKPFSTTVSYDQDAATQHDNGFKACMREKGIAGYEDAPLPVKQ